MNQWENQEEKDFKKVIQEKTKLDRASCENIIV